MQNLKNCNKIFHFNPLFVHFIFDLFPSLPSPKTPSGSFHYFNRHSLVILNLHHIKLLSASSWLPQRSTNKCSFYHILWTHVSQTSKHKFSFKQNWESLLKSTHIDYACENPKSILGSYFCDISEGWSNNVQDVVFLRSFDLVGSRKKRRMEIKV